MALLRDEVTDWFVNQIGVRFFVGQQFPVLGELMVMFEEDTKKLVSRLTVVEGLKPLRNSGIIRVRQGIPSVVVRMPAVVNEWKGDSTEEFEEYREHPLMQMAIATALQAIHGGLLQEESLKDALVMVTAFNKRLA